MTITPSEFNTKFFIGQSLYPLPNFLLHQGVSSGWLICLSLVHSQIPPAAFARSNASSLILWPVRFGNCRLLDFLTIVSPFPNSSYSLRATTMSATTDKAVKTIEKFKTSCNSCTISVLPEKTVITAARKTLNTISATMMRNAFVVIEHLFLVEERYHGIHVMSTMGSGSI
jgi:hypothetical protein